MTTPAVYTAICQVMREVAKEGIAKTRDNQQTRSKFRGIDDVYNALSGPLASAGLVILPSVVEHAQTERESKAGGALYCSTVVVDYTFISAADGSTHVARVIGEAMDSSDKSFAKAMSFAYKYACFQAFCIPTEGDNDADAHRPEPKPRSQTQAPPQQRQTAPARTQSSAPPQDGKYTRYWALFKNSSNVGKPLKDVATDSLTTYMDRLKKALPHADYGADARKYLDAAEIEMERRIDLETGEVSDPLAEKLQRSIDRSRGPQIDETDNLPESWQGATS